MTLVDHADRPRPERKPLPTKEQILAINDIPALEAIEVELDRVAKKIEVDLEFEVGDEDWDGRARGALTAHRICLGQVQRRIGALRRGERKGPAPGSPEYVTAKAQKALANAERQRALADANRAAGENHKTKLAQSRLDLMERTAFQGHFLLAAQRLLPADLLAQITEAALRSSLGAMRGAVPPVPESEE